MRKITLALIAVILLALAVAVWGQPAPLIEWTHDGSNLTHFECQVDSGAQNSLLGLVTQDGTTYTTPLSNCGWSGVALGQHLLYIRACNGASCSSPAPGIYVVKL